MQEQGVCSIKPESGAMAAIRKWLGISTIRRGSDCYPKSLYVVTGAVIGISGVILSWLGNPPNTGFCVSCFMENIAGAIGLHGNIRMQYLRPEIIGFVIGAFLMSVRNKEFAATGGSSPLLRFFVGILLIIGCAVFIGCPSKMVFRLAAGDLTALIACRDCAGCRARRCGPARRPTAPARRSGPGGRSRRRRSGSRAGR